MAQPQTQKAVDLMNEQQLEAYNFLSCLLHTKYKIAGINGAGGVGKSFVLKELANHYKVAFTAPTNQASDAFALVGCTPDDCMTIHRMLGFKVNEGEGVLTLDKHNPPQYHNYDVVVVDECSMINQQILDAIIKASRYVRFIMSGDTHQAYPVGLQESPAFAVCEKSFTLTTNERLKGVNNPLGNLLNYLRTCIDKNTDIKSIDFMSFAKKVKVDGKLMGVSVTSNDKDFLKWCELGIKRNFYVIAYHNATVNNYNEYLQNHLHKTNDFVVGQDIIFNQGYKKTYKNGEIVEIEELSMIEKTIVFEGRKLVVECVQINEDIVAFKDKEKYLGFLGAYAAMCKSMSKGYDWATYFKYRNAYADISHKHAITGHKSQGLTRDNVAVDMRDIIKSPATNQEKLRIAYTACSRARYAIAIKV